MELPSKAIFVIHEIPASSTLTERENTFQKPYLMGFEFNVGYHLCMNLLSHIPLYICGILFNLCRSHKALNGFFQCRKETCLAHCSALVNTQRQSVCVVIGIFTTKILKIFHC